jgi:uncharacterized membrane protein
MRPAAFWRDRSASMSILFAAAFAALAAACALAVDLGALYHQRRALQAGVDLAAISAAADPTRARDIAQSVLHEAGLLAPGGAFGLDVVAGRYDPTRPRIADRFDPSSRLPANAVRVTLRQPGALYFSSTFLDVPTLSASGLAAMEPQVSFSVGSRLASLNGGIANAVLSELLGLSVTLSVLDYTALASARIDVFGFLDALATRLDVTAGTYEELLETEIGAGLVASTLSGLTGGTASTVLARLGRAGQGRAVALEEVFALGEMGQLRIGSAGAVAGLSLSALEMLSAVAALADGERQVSLALGASLPGLASLELDLAIGEPPQGGGWFGIGPEGTVVRTAQLRLRLKARLLGSGVLGGLGVNLPLFLDVAPAQARVAVARCPTPGHPRGSVAINVLPGVVTLALGDPSDDQIADFATMPPASRVRLIDALLLRVSGSGRVEVAQTTPVRLDFSSTDIAAGALKTARAQTAVTSLAGSLLSSLTLQVDLLGIGLSPASVILSAVRGLIVPLAPTLDMTINAVFSALGLGIGEADVRVYGVRCHRAVLVG